VAVLGALVNGQLTSTISHQLRAEGLGGIVPFIMKALATGNVSMPSTAGNPGLRNVVAKATVAAEHAFANGLHLALVVSGVLLLVAAVVAVLTVDQRRDAVTQTD
ncbi:MAG: hypothetical protein ACREOE_04870, partial [Gemmatimonadales bacterium]